MISQFAPAKLNLCLHMTGRRDDGYHFLDSLMIFTAFGDHVHIAPADKPSLNVTGDRAALISGDLLSVERDSPNLIIKALYAMADATGNTPDIAITLDKNIPSGAGLGGGSADAAALMIALNTLWGNQLSQNDMAQIGLPLGTELPVCLARQSTRVRGVGDITESVPHMPPFPILIVWPHKPLLTADVFKHYRQRNAAFDAPLPAMPNGGDWIDYLQNTTNGLTETAIALCPAIGDIITTLSAQNGCVLARMSGSGSACFGIFENDAAMHDAAASFSNYHVVTTHNL